MDINLLVLNVGNTRLSIGVFVAGDLQFTTRIPHDNRADWEGRIADAWGRIEAKENAAVAGASVNPQMAKAIEQAVKKATGQGVEWVGDEIDLPIKVMTDEPQQTGVDRVVTVAAAHEQMGKGCVVVDAGTAISVDCCNDAGEFLGGSISPGLSMMLDALHEQTAQLPRVQFHAPSGTFGKSTEEAILHGVYHGVRGMVKELVENYATELGYWPDVIATGGDAAQLFEGWELIHAISPDLTLYGVALAYANHYIKHGT
jgi:type III pantothenate kinase